ncbi:MBL fold metallo-hydrolase [Streptomyces griseus]|uniref:MBL fold metallo-hydrolase n=1 Tax=Streptomyces griseus TaxID=1911 RepID=UPI00214C07FD|nr:MBL fold metallo-hydrolase [Streptomyces griseus]
MPFPVIDNDELAKLIHINADGAMPGMRAATLSALYPVSGAGDAPAAPPDQTATEVAPALADATGAPILLHPDDLPLWLKTHPEHTPDGDLTDGQELTVAGITLTVLHTPGHAPGAVCLYAPELATVFTGDTLFQGGPGATGRSFSSFPTIIDSIRDRLLTLPGDTKVRTGHGDPTTIGAEAPGLDEWIKRGH